MNRTLARLLRRSTGIAAPDALERVLAESVAGGKESEEYRALVAGLREFVSRLDAALDHNERDIDLRTRSLELTSEELVGANERLRSDLAMRDRVLEALREAAATLLGTHDPAAVPDAADIEGLSALLPALVRQQEANRAELAESERKFSELYRNSPVMLHTTDASGTLTSVNDLWLARLGYDRAEVIGRNVTAFMTEGSRRRAIAEIRPRIRRTGSCKEVPCRFLRKDGTPVDVLLSAYVEATPGNPRSLEALVDVTEQLRSRRMQEALHGISEAAHADTSLPETLRRIHGIIEKLLPARNFFVALHDTASGELTFPYFVDEHDSPPPPRRIGEGGLTEEVLRTGEALLLNPETMALRLRRGERVFGTDSIDWLGVPLRTKAGTIGALVVQSYEGAVRYGESDKALLETVGNQVAAAVERNTAQRALRESEDRLQRALDASRLTLWDLDFESGRLYFSETWSEMLGGPRVPTVTTLEALSDLVRPEDRDAVRKAMVPMLKGREDAYHVEHRIIRPDGQVIWIHSEGRVIERAPDGTARRAVGTNRDITERKRAEEALELAALVYQHSSEAMTVCDAQHRIIAINPAFTALTGYTAEEVMGKNPRILSSGRHDEAFYRRFWEELNEKGRWQGEIWNRHRDGREFAESLSINTIRGPDGAVHRYVALFSDITAKKEAENLIWQQANFDALTQLPNRRMFRDRLEQLLARSRRDGSQVAILFIDLDRFKEVNDTLGHDRGDQLLVEAARRVRECVRESDTVARFGGDEFTVALGELSDTGRVQVIAQSIIDSLSAAVHLGPDAVFVTASVGITLFPGDGSEIEDLFKNADQALYVAKASGRNRFSYFTPELQVAALARMHVMRDLRAAIAQGQFSLDFQPIVELQTGRVRKAEALVRWHHPTKGLISPAQFIPEAESSGLIVEIGGWVFREAMQWALRWRKAGMEDFQVSINQSPRELHASDGLHASIVSHLASCGLPGQCVTVEITEGLLLDASDEVKQRLRRMTEAGVEVAIDDFGIGYSSLSYLKNLNIDYLKIDQSFVRNLAPGSSDMALSEAIIVMAHKLGLRVVAEGVETAAQAELLRSAGCDFAQGYHFGRPMPAEAFESYLLKAPAARASGT